MYFHSPPPAAQEGRPRQRQQSGRYDWRARQQSRPSANPPTALLHAASSPGSAGIASDDPSEHLNNRSFDAVSWRRSGRASLSSSLSSGFTFGVTTPADFSLASLGTSASDSVDGPQERCAHTAYRVTFSGNNSVKERPTSVVVNGVQFLLVERYVSGHSDGVYQKNKKLWEHVPRGQVKVFKRVAASPPPFSSAPGSPATEDSGSLHGSPIAGEEEPPARSPAHLGSSFHRCDTTGNSGSGGGGGQHTYVATLSGMRKFGLWGDSAAAAVFNVGKETPVEVTALDCMDGESGQLTAFTVDGVRYWLVGARERHLLVRLHVPDEDVAAYGEMESTITGRRTHTALAQHIAYTWRAFLLTYLGESDMTALHDLISRNQWTFCFEACLKGWERFVDYSQCVVADGDDDNGNSSKGDDQGHTTHAAGGGVPRRAVGGQCGGFNPRNEGDVRCLHSDEEAAASSKGGGSPTSKTNASDDCTDWVSDFLCFYAITMDTPSEKGLCMPTHEAMRIFRQYHLRVPAMRSGDSALQLNTSEFAALKDSSARAMNSAGVVFYATNELGIVVRVCRSRCYPHSMERVLQENIVTHRLSGAPLRAKIAKKLSNLPKDVKPHVLQWERERAPVLLRFADWLHRTKQLTPSADLSVLRELRGYWISTQLRYAEDVQTAEAEEVEGGRVDGCDSDAEEGEEVEEAEESAPPDVIMLVGPQGCGKSTLARTLFVLLEESGCRPLWLNQDEVGGRRAYLSAIHRAATQGKYTHLILDKMNLDEVARAEYGELQLRVVLAVAWQHAQGTEALVDVCLERVKRRGSHHRTFRALEEGPDTTPVSEDSHSGGDAQLRRLRGILKDSASRYEAPTAVPMVELDVTLNCNASVMRVWATLQDRGRHSLPALNTLDSKWAFDVAFEYESLMAVHPRKVESTILQAVDRDSILQLIPVEMLSTGKKVVSDIQVLLHSFTEHPSPSAFVHYASLLNSSVRLRVKAVVSDSKATILQVECAPSMVAAGSGSGSGGAGGKNGGAASYCPLVSCSLGDHSGDRGSPPPPSLTSSLRAAVLQPSYFAVVAKAKKATYKYSKDLFLRYLREGDPHTMVHPLPTSTEAQFTYQFVVH